MRGNPAFGEVDERGLRAGKLSHSQIATVQQRTNGGQPQWHSCGKGELEPGRGEFLPRREQ